MTECAGIVLCGGLSSRMGRAKAWLPWHGQPLVCHVVSRLREVVSSVVVVASSEMTLPTGLEGPGVRVVRDPEPALGPLAGLAEGLAQLGSGPVFATGTDAPFLSTAFIETMLTIGTRGAAAPLVDGHVQTLAAVYPGGADTLARTLLQQGRRRPLELLEAFDFRAVDAGELPDLQSLEGFNTPEDYLAAARREEPGAVAHLEIRGEAAQELPIGTLAEVLSLREKGLGANDNEIFRDTKVQRHFHVSLGTPDRIRDVRIPIGPGERVVVESSD